MDSITKNLKDSHKTAFDSKIIYITAGFRQREKHMEILQDMKDALLHDYSTTSNTVVGIITWKRGASRRYSMEGGNDKASVDEKWEKHFVCCRREDLTYGRASINSWPIGNVLGYLHEQVVTSDASHKTDSYCIGLSLGAHLCGFFGKILNEMTTMRKGNYVLKRIIGFDPAGPIFDDPLQHSTLRLNKDDADIVEVIHTNTETKGYEGPLGDLDFYINTGYRQPWCPKPLNRMDRWMNTSSCSHRYATYLFIQIIMTDFPCFISPMTNKISDRNIPVNTKKLEESKLRPTCIDGKPVIYLGDVSDKLSIPKGTYCVHTENESERGITKSCKLYFGALLLDKS